MFAISVLDAVVTVLMDVATQPGMDISVHAYAMSVLAELAEGTPESQECLVPLLQYPMEKLTPVERLVRRRMMRAGI